MFQRLFISLMDSWATSWLQNSLHLWGRREGSEEEEEGHWCVTVCVIAILPSSDQLQTVIKFCCFSIPWYLPATNMLKMSAGHSKTSKSIILEEAEQMHKSGAFMQLGQKSYHEEQSLPLRIFKTSNPGKPRCQDTSSKASHSCYWLEYLEHLFITIQKQAILLNCVFTFPKIA